MRAKEYLHIHYNELKHAEIVGQTIKDLLPLRLDKVATCEYMNRHLSADTRYQHYILQNDLYERGNAMQQHKPEYETVEGEVAIEIASEVREELFRVIEHDGSFGHLFYILGTERNSHHNSEPIDCIPNEERIIQCLKENRDDYPKGNLDAYINENLNYKQYSMLVDGQYWEDDDSIYLKYFNRVYEIYDEIRLRKQSVSAVKGYLKRLKFGNDAEKYWTYAFIIKLIEEYGGDDESLGRCKREIERVIEPMRDSYIAKSANELKSPVNLADRRGLRIDIIRVLNVLYELGTFTGNNGEPISKKDFMTAMGKSINMDLSNYDKDLSRALSDSTAIEKHLKIFNDMTQKMTDIFNRH